MGRVKPDVTKKKAVAAAPRAATATGRRAATAAAAAAATATACSGAEPRHVAEVGDRLWGLCSPVPSQEYQSPWGAVAREMRDKLADALGSAAALDAASSASHLGYAACTKKLASDARAIYRIMVDIRGLAMSVVPTLVDAKKDQTAPDVPPGVVLVYEDLAYVN